MTDRYQTLLNTLDDLGLWVEKTIQALRDLDHVGPMSVREVNGRVDDLLIDLQKIATARDRLMGRTQTAQRTGHQQVVGPQELAGTMSEEPNYG